MSYPIKCCAVTAFNTVTTIGLSYGSRFYPKLSFLGEGGRLFAGIAGITYSLHHIAADITLDYCIPNTLRNHSTAVLVRNVVITVSSFFLSALLTTLISPNIGSLLGLRVSYKTAAAYSLFHAPTTLLISTLVKYLQKK